MLNANNIIIPEDMVNIIMDYLFFKCTFCQQSTHFSKNSNINNVCNKCYNSWCKDQYNLCEALYGYYE